MMCTEHCGFQCEYVVVQQLLRFGDHSTSFRKDTYEVIVAKSAWPYREIMEAAAPEELVQIEHFKRTSAFISIRYSTIVQVIRDFEPRFLSGEQFICSVGGLIAMWIGICMIDLFGIVDSIISRLLKIKI